MNEIGLFAKKHKLNFLAIQESKMENLDMCMVRSFWRNVAFSPSRGAWGSIIAIWDLDVIAHKKIVTSDSFVAIEAIRMKSGLNI